MEKREELYRGKAKSVYKTDDANRLILLFRNDTSAFDGKRIEQLDRKGMVNNKFNAFIMQKLEEAGIPTQFDKLLGDNECLVKKLDMIPVECVVRNYAAGSLVKRLGVEEGLKLNPYTFELFLKDDAKGDPFINESHVVAFGWGTAEQLARMKELSLKVNDVLNKLFDDAGLLLVDFKLEFGVFHDGSIVLGDEFSPDGCRLWDKDTKKKMDKDRFRQGLGDVIEAYEEVANRRGVPLSSTQASDSTEKNLLSSFAFLNHTVMMRAVGEMPEWPNGTDSKSVVPSPVPRVRIPISPPLHRKSPVAE